MDRSSAPALSERDSPECQAHASFSFPPVPGASSTLMSNCHRSIVSRVSFEMMAITRREMLPARIHAEREQAARGQPPMRSRARVKKGLTLHLLHDLADVRLEPVVGRRQEREAVLLDEPERGERSHQTLASARTMRAGEHEWLRLGEGGHT